MVFDVVAFAAVSAAPLGNVAGDDTMDEYPYDSRTNSTETAEQPVKQWGSGDDCDEQSFPGLVLQ
jgi:hypothetical protein